MTIYLNGHYMPIEEAKISVLDRGFIFGDGRLQMLVADNGKGFTVNNTSDGMGMRNVQERIRQMGGTLRLHSRPDEGTLFQFSIPLSPLTHASTQI